MRQFQLQQVKFPKPQPLPQSNVQKPPPPQKPTAQSEMIRIIIALLIAIFIFNDSQETTINYNEIIKNQKMFLVKNIRGVIPTLSGNVNKLQNALWKVVHFQNYKQNDSQIFTNFTLLFNANTLVVENTYCNTVLKYDWKNYSYNIDFSLISDNTKPMVQAISDITDELNGLKPSQENNRDLQDNIGITQPNQNDNTADINQKSALQSSNDERPIVTQKQIIKPLQDDLQDTKRLSNKVSAQTSETTKIQSQEQKKCTKTINYFKSVILFTSVYTISSKNLYLLMEDASTDEDFYMILQPIN